MLTGQATTFINYQFRDTPCDTMFSENIQKAIEALREGKSVFIFDAEGREEETDFVMAAAHCQPEHIRQMRRDCGGLIFLMVDHSSSERLGLPFMSDLLYKEASRYPVLKELIPNDIPYDTKSSFSIAINHRKTFTGITDKDRALTVKEFGLLCARLEDFEHDVDAQREFGTLYRSPGHVPICRSSKQPLLTRHGHTELSVALLTMAEMTPVAVGCEMMGDDDNARPKEQTRAYALEHGCVFLEGKEIIDAWGKWLEK